MNVVFILMHIPDPRMNKRIAVAKELAAVSVVCTRRLNQNIYEPVHEDVKHYIYDIDVPTSRNLFRRYLVSKKFERMAYEKLKAIKPDIIYCGSIDTLAIACKYKKNYLCRIIFEVADVRECFLEQPKSIRKKLEKMAVKSMEERYFQSLDCLAITSMAFYDAHYSTLIEKNKVLYVPNTPDISVFENYKHKVGGTFTVGFIGAIRYLEQMKILVDSTGEVGCNLLFAGAGDSGGEFAEITEYCKDNPWVTFTGKYNYATEISTLYGKVDAVYAVYDADNPNVRIALPNKLYESVYCELPLIVAKNTYLSEVVEKYSIGISVGHKLKKELCDALHYLMNEENYKKIMERCSREKDNLVSSNWTDSLKKIISGTEA